VVADDECTQIFPHQFPAVLRVRLTDGSEREVKVLTNRGGPDRPLSFDELAQKFSDNASRVLDESAVGRIRDSVATLDTLDDLAVLLEGASIPLTVEANA